jgi:hypothetical protein
MDKLRTKHKRNWGGEQMNEEAPKARKNLDQLMQKQNILAV